VDENKLKKLREIGYVVQGCCGLCKHSMFVSGRLFGSCYKHSYQHKKHTGSERPLSITQSGLCFDYEFNENWRQHLHKYMDLMEK